MKAPLLVLADAGLGGTMFPVLWPALPELPLLPPLENDELPLPELEPLLPLLPPPTLDPPPPDELTAAPPPPESAPLC